MELILVFSILFLGCVHGVSSESDSRYFNAMFSLGDSYIDAGNFVIMAAAMVPAVPVWHDKLPYGMNFFGRPTGRLSDGRNIIDFIAQEFGLPLLGASLLNDSDIFNGINFARLIKGGAVYVVVPGNPPLGCSPNMLTSHSDLNTTTEYNTMGCLSDVNRVGRHHNSLLRAAVVSLRGKYRHATIIFADFYTPIIKILSNPSHFGVGEADVLRACCRVGGHYNWNDSAICGMPEATAYKDPSAFVNWDGVHYTEATNGYIANWWLHGPSADPPIMCAIRY